MPCTKKSKFLGNFSCLEIADILESIISSKAVNILKNTLNMKKNIKSALVKNEQKYLNGKMKNYQKICWMH